jgi:hypothetical protein
MHFPRSFDTASRRPDVARMLFMQNSSGIGHRGATGILGSIQQRPVAERVPPLGLRRVNGAPRQRAGQPLGRSVVKTGRAPAEISERRLSATNSRTAAICSRVTSNCSMTSSMLSSSRFSMTVATLQGMLDSPTLGPVKDAICLRLQITQKAPAVTRVQAARLGVSISSEQAAAVWAIADKLTRDLATIG